MESSSSGVLEKEKASLDLNDGVSSSRAPEASAAPEQSKRKVYTLGLAFNHDLSKIALAYKNHPSWQEDRYNGIGGEVKESESVLDGMIREFQEETGVQVDEWNQLGMLTFEDAYVHVFASRLPSNQFIEIDTKTNEKVDIISLRGILRSASEKDFNKYYIDDLAWLIPLAVAKLRNWKDFDRFEA